MSTPIKVQCPDCGKRYQLAGEVKTPVIECPRCAAKIPVPGVAGVGRSALREELERLKSQDSSVPVQAAPKMRVVDEEEILSSRGRVIAFIVGILLVLALFGGGGAWLVFRLAEGTPGGGGLMGQPINEPDVVAPDTSTAVIDDTPVETEVQTAEPTKLPKTVQVAYAEALKPTDPCGEEDALARWRSVQKMLQQYPKLAVLQLQTAEARIAEIESALAKRQKALDGLQKRLDDAKARGDSGKKRQARMMAGAVVRDIGKLDCRGPVAEKLREQALEIQKTYAETTTPATTTVAVGTDVKPPAIVDDPDVVLDKPAPGTETRWRDEKAWANAIVFKLLGAPDSLYRSLEHQRGDKDKWVATMRQPMDISDYQHLVLDAKVDETVKMALGVWVGGELYESREQAVRRDKSWRTVTYDLKAGNFKCAKTNWNYSAKIEKPEKVTGFSLFFYSQAGSPILIANVRLHKVK